MSVCGTQSDQLLSGYQFLALDRLPLTRERAEAVASESRLKGTVLLAPEGVNFSLFGARDALERWLDWIGSELGATAPILNRQRAEASPFLRLKVRVREEIVTFDAAVRPDLDVGGTRLEPEAWNRLLEREGVQLVDTRNDYEFGLGSFDGALNPGTANFAEFKGWCEKALDPARPVAMFCTGGIRCEKASAWLRGRGFDEVYQLHGGILGYLDRVEPEAARWTGECFVFDDRVSIDAELQPTGRVVCRGCRRPADGLDAAGVPPIDREGRCELCAEVFDAARLGSLRERARQARLAAERGRAHFGPESRE